MKNLLRSTLYLCVFALAGIVFQISCSNSERQAATTTPFQNKIIFTNLVGNGNQTFWTCNYDGSNLTQIPITLPAGVNYYTASGNSDAKISPDGQKVFIKVMNYNNNNTEIYSCDINGANFQLVTSIPNSGLLSFSVN